MPDLQKIMRICRRCTGSGTETIGTDPLTGIPYDPITCRKCDGAGEISTISLHPDLIGLFNDMNSDISDIKEKVNEIKAIVDAL